MKKYQSINYFTGSEQHTLILLKNKIVELYEPLMIYLISTKSSTYVTRSCFTKPRTTEQKYFTCDFLIVLPNNASIPENAMRELKNIHERVQLMVYSFDFVRQQLLDYSLFFCWIQRKAIVLYEKDNAGQKLPEPIHNIKQYEQQAHQIFADNSHYHKHIEVKLSPLPVKVITDQMAFKLLMYV